MRISDWSSDVCSSDLATQDPTRQRGLVVEDKAERVRRFQAATVSALWDITGAMGLKTPWALSPHHLHERQNSAGTESSDSIYSVFPRRGLPADPASVANSGYWALAGAVRVRAEVAGNRGL